MNSSPDHPIGFQTWVNSDFWRHNQPAQHFETPSSMCPAALAQLLESVCATPPTSAPPTSAPPTSAPPATVIEIGAGDGVLLAALQRRWPQTELVAVDQRPVPGAPRSVVDRWDERANTWSSGAVAELVAELRNPVLVVAVEWLDDLACPLLPGDHELCNTAELAWAERWWPAPDDPRQAGTRREIGLGRDLAWSWWARHLPGGSVLAMVDFGHTAATRPAGGGLRAYRDGRRVPVSGESSVNLTAAVAIDSVASSLESLGCEQLYAGRLREAPAGAYQGGGVAGLELRSQDAVLRDPRHFGDFWLLAHRTPLTATTTATAAAAARV